MTAGYERNSLSAEQATILDGYFGHGVLVKPAVVRALKGNGNAAILLSQFVYWSVRQNYADGWFYNTQQEIEAQTGLSADVQKRARRVLCESGILEETNKTVGNRLHYRIKLTLIADILAGEWSVTVQAPANPDSGNRGIREPGILETPTRGGRNPRTGDSRIDKPPILLDKTSTKTSPKTSLRAADAAPVTVHAELIPTLDDLPDTLAKNAEADFFGVCFDIYRREKAEIWVDHDELPDTTKGHLRAVARKRKGWRQAAELYRDALRNMRSDPKFFGVTKLTIVNLGSKDKFTTEGESYRAHGGASAADARTHQTAQAIWEAIN